MVEILRDVGSHNGTWGDGHYEVIVHDDRQVIIKTVLNNAPHQYTVTYQPMNGID